MALSIEARYLEPDVPAELDQTYRRTFARLKGLFRSRGCTPEEAADLAQEAAMRAYMHVRRWGVSGDGLDPLINRIARNLLIDRHRRVVPFLVPLDSAEDVGDPQLDPTEEVIRRQRSSEVHSAVRQLPDRHQTALMYSLNGLTPAEVAERLGIGRNAADALLHRARRSLRQRLAQTGEGAFGIVLWFKIRAREAVSKITGVPVEAAGTGAMSATVAAAAAIVAVLNVAVAPGAGASIPSASPVARDVISVAADGGVTGTQGIEAAAGSETTSGRTTVDLPGGAGVGAGNGRINGNAEVPHPTEPDRKLFGVAPDFFHQENESSLAGTAYDEACSFRQRTCNSLYQDPIDTGGGAG